MPSHTIPTKRYLLAFILNPANNVSIFPKVYSLKKACSPDEVTLPGKTIFFAFASAEVDTAEELQSAFLGITIGGIASISSSIPYTVENNGKFFFVGTQVRKNGITGVYNSDTKCFIPLYCLEGMNYEIIDL